MRVRVELDQAFSFWFTQVLESDKLSETVLEIDPALFAEVEEVSARYYAVRAQVEQLYRVQQGLNVWQTPAVPAHTLIPPTDIE